MANPTPDFPTAVHTNVDTSGFGSLGLGATTPNHADLHGKQEEEVTAVQTKVGTGSSTPTSGTVLKGNGTGTSAWGTLTESDITDLGTYQVQPAEGAFVDGDKTKLDGIEASADVTDATNVNSAGAVMESDVTAKGDVFVATASGALTNLAVGTDAQVLTADSAEASGVKWATAAAGGGQTTFDVIVAPSGGDYTTLSDALNNATAGQSIFVEAGTYTEGGVSTFNVANVTVVARSPETTVCNFGTNNFIASTGTDHFRMYNVGVLSSTGFVYLNDDYQYIEGCKFEQTGTNSYFVLFNSIYGTFKNNYCISASTLTTQPVFRLDGSHNLYDGNTFIANATCTSANYGQAGICVEAYYSRVQNNYFSKNTTGSNYVLGLDNGGSYVTFTGNYIKTDTGSGCMSMNDCTYVTVTGNFFESTTSDYGIYSSDLLSCTISSNTIRTTGSTGIIVSSSDNVTVSNNAITSPTIRGIYVSSSSDGMTISNNTIFASGDGIHVQAGTLVTVSGNHITVGASKDGIDVGSSSTKCVITGNVIDGASSGRGIYYVGDYGTVTGNYIDSAVATPIFITSTKKGITVKNNGGTSPADERQTIVATNTSGATINQGDIVTWKAVAGGDEITTTTTASDDLVYGVADESINDTATGHVLVQGKTVYLKVDGTTDIAIGDFITTFTTAGIGAKASSGQLAIAIALEAYTTDDSNGVIDALVIEPRRL